MKQDLTTAPVLTAPDFTKAFEVVADATEWSIGAVLLLDGRPLAFESRKMIPAELNYTKGVFGNSARHESLAMLYGGNQQGQADTRH